MISEERHSRQWQIASTAFLATRQQAHRKPAIFLDAVEAPGG